MAQPIRPRTPAGRIKDNSERIVLERHKPVMPGPWVYVGDFDALDPPVATWQSPSWLNGWTWVDPFYVGFRHGVDGETEFTGVVDTSNAVSGTVAFQLPIPWRPLKEFSFITDMDLGGGDFDGARVVVEARDAGATAGNVTIYFPLTA
jgi:hypothetical protein